MTKVIPVKTMPLEAVLDRYLPAGKVIDFMSIDAEGLDAEILQSNNWNKYRPLFMIVESCVDMQDICNCQVYQYLTARNYKLMAKTMRTMFFKLM